MIISLPVHSLYGWSLCYCLTIRGGDVVPRDTPQGQEEQDHEFRQTGSS